ncbi:carboxypeptidase-like regulatory domain-containing protein [Nocardioides sp. YIM 152588]|uniref:MSCRAMM family protein n=1 Tax=Nocardioides sp. YIM 152588 TaxID=3158259 RepID=UPI0032E432C9
MQRPQAGTTGGRPGAAPRRVAGLLILMLMAAVVETVGLAAPASAALPTGVLKGHVGFYTSSPEIVCEPWDFTCVPGSWGTPGDPVAGVTVQAVALATPGEVVGSATTDADGDYSMQVPVAVTYDGEYYYDEFYLRYSAAAIDDGWYVSNVDAVSSRRADATTIGLGQGSSSEVIALVHPHGTTQAIPGDVSGTVVTSDDDPVEGADVTVWRKALGGGWESAASGTTGADGAYSIGFDEVDPDSTYTVSATTRDVTVHAGDAEALDDAVGVTLTGPHTFPTLTFDVAAITDTLAGTVTDAPAGTTVEALAWDEDASAWTSADPALTTTTDDDGRWAFRSLPDGIYTLRYADAIYGNGLLTPPGLVGSTTYVVADNDRYVVPTFALPRIGSITGTVDPADALVTLYRWTGSAWVQQETTTAESGAYSLTALSGTYTLKLGAEGHGTAYLGGGDGLPANGKASAASLTVDSTTPVVVPAVTLAATPTSDFGTVAGQAAPACADRTPITDPDGATVDLPFPLSVGGTPYSSAYVATHGYVSLGADGGMSGASVTAPTLAPFATSAGWPAGGTVSWGTDEHTLCVVWEAQPDPYETTPGTTTFQLLLTSVDGAPGRQAGDADVTFNYDRVAWDSDLLMVGMALNPAATSEGSAIGWTQLTAPVGVTDTGQRPLVAGSLDSTTPGRYNLSIRNPAPATTGTLLVSGPNRSLFRSQRLTVVACPAETTRKCVTATHVAVTSPQTAITGLTPGDYTVTWQTSAGVDSALGLSPTPGADQSSDRRYLPDPVTATVVAGQETGVYLGTRVADPVPADVQLTTIGISNSGAPAVQMGQAFSWTAPCTGATVTYTFTSDFDGQVSTGTMTETTPGKLQGTIPMLHGSVRVSFTTTCPGEEPTTSAFDVYIDPSGTVVDQYGRPVGDATVVLLRSDTMHGMYAPVPDGSTVMSPSNRVNPWTTPADGGFHWDVIAGWYLVEASKDGCTSGSTDPMQVPVERTEIVLKLTCSSAAGGAPVAPEVSGTAEVGGTLTAAAHAPEGFTPTYRWLRNGAAITGATGATYRLTKADAGRRITAAVTYQRPDAPIEAGSDTLVSFEPLTATSAETAVAALKKATLRARAVGRAGIARVSVRLSLEDKPTTRVSGKVTVTVSGAKAVTAKVRRGRATVTVRNLERGRHKVTVRYAGSPTHRAATKRLTVRVR